MPLVRWSKPALQDLGRLHTFLKARSTAAASRAIASIRAASRVLEQYPQLGEPRAGGLRDHSAPFGASAYMLRYMIDPAGNIFILRVWHSREDRNES